MKDNFNPDDLLESLFQPETIKVEEDLKELFQERIDELNIKKTTALKMMGMATRTLDGIITGQQKKLDYTHLIKLSNFLGISIERIAKLYIDKVRQVHEKDIYDEKTGDLINFVNDNFNLAELRKVGLIDSLTDYTEIIKSICQYFGLRKIEDYKEPDINIAFSAGKMAKSTCSIKNWVFTCKQTSIELKNPNKYDRNGLVEYFSQIRWYSTDVLNGLVTVVNHLYQLGITVVFVPSYPSMHIRGATFEVNNKPSIAIANYKGFYPTLWFALIHELYHVLFDWDDIVRTECHLSLERDEKIPTTSKSEIEADDFAREYLFSKEKTKKVGEFIHDDKAVEKFALENHVHPSFAYVFSAFDNGNSNKYLWGKARNKNPNITPLLNKIQNPFDSKNPFDNHIKKLRTKIYK
jgi:HTH-type transcriptional regulator/antitoxin HigA